MAKIRILIIDDDKELCNLVKKNLEQRGDFEIVMAYNGKAGIKLAKKARPNLILLDILMPGMDGFSVLKRLKQDEATMSIPVVMLSGVGDEEAKLKAHELYDEMYITKPVIADDLKAKIDEVLRRKAIG